MIPNQSDIWNASGRICDLEQRVREQVMRIAKLETLYRDCRESCMDLYVDEDKYDAWRNETESRIEATKKP